MPVASSEGVYSSHSVPSTTLPLAGGWSMPTRATESPSGSMPVSGTGMRVIWPCTAHALSALGTGALLAAEEAMTSNVTVVVARLPTKSMAVYATRTTPASEPAARRTWLPVTKTVPSSAPDRTSTSGSRLSDRPIGERSFDRTLTEPMSSARTFAVSAVTWGGVSSLCAFVGMTLTWAVAEPAPLETV